MVDPGPLDEDHLAWLVIDVGGGHGFLLASILQQYPRLRGVLFDAPSVIDGAKDAIEAHGIELIESAAPAKAKAPSREVRCSVAVNDSATVRSLEPPSVTARSKAGA